jgi:hypothetical protein
MMVIDGVFAGGKIQVDMALENELQFFAENKAQWTKAHLGKFVLVKGSELIGVYDNAETAITEGAKRFGAESFLVRQLNPEEKDIYIPALALGLLHAHPA